MNISDQTSPDSSPDYMLVESAISYFQEHQSQQPTLAVVAEELGISDGHLQRLFRKWVGLTPKQYLQTLTVDKAKELLNESRNLFDTALETGLSGSSRLHDHFINLEAMTPAEYRSSGQQLTIEYGVVHSPFGQAFVAFTDRGICQLSFEDTPLGEDGLARVRSQWPQANLVENQAVAKKLLTPVWSSLGDGADSIRLLVQGTNFQVKVWRALLNIPAGAVADYSTIANMIGKPSSTRAVASAIGANPVAFLIPCHRVIRRDGGLGGYRWGLPRKQLLLAKELSTERSRSVA